MKPTGYAPAPACGGDLGLGGDRGEETGFFLPPTVVAGAEGRCGEWGGEALREWIGPYRLREVLGEGGFGVVYLAEQLEPMRREVALKVIKPGMDSFDILRRFEGEGRALARMEHPNIAGALDAGTTAGGRPYFAMELVRGVPITAYCDERRLSLRERLELFRPVCLAVHHAHQKAILHRDLKPSNLLVVEVDGKPVTKVIDFGIAKALDGAWGDAERSVHRTMEGLVVGTPQYMSPEQAGATADLDTRSDIYALGIVLHELLVGATPLGREARGQLPLGEVLRLVREGEVKRPSLALGGRDRELVAQRRGTSGSRLEAAVRGELDWIVLRALERERERRYDSARALADDLERFLGDQPVAAGPPSRAYQWRKFLRRHRGAVAGAAGGAVVLGGGVAASLWQAEEAQEARAKAEGERQNAVSALRGERQARLDAEDLASFLARVFESPHPERDGRTITVLEALQNAGRSLEEDLVGQGERRAKLQGALGGTYQALGLAGEAIALQEKVRDFYVGRFGGESGEALLAKQNLASSYYLAGRREEALALREEVLAGRHWVPGEEGEETLEAMNRLSVSYYAAGRAEEALRLREDILAGRRRIHGVEHVAVLRAMNNLAKSYFEAGRREEALTLREEVLAGRRRLLGREHVETLAATFEVAKSYQAAGRRDEALRMGEVALAGRLHVLGPEHPSTLSAMGAVASAWHDKGDWDEALRRREALLALSAKVLGAGHPDTLGAKLNLSVSYFFADRREECLRLREEVYALREKALGKEHPVTLSSLALLAASYGSGGRLEEGIALQERYLRISEGLWPRGHERLRSARKDLVELYVKDGQDEAAAALREEMRLELVTK